MSLGDIFSFPARFALKIFWYGFLALLAILAIRICYCVMVANANLDNIMPQIARYIAEENGITTEAGSTESYKGIYELLRNESLQSDGTVKSEYHYKYGTGADAFKTSYKNNVGKTLFSLQVKVLKNDSHGERVSPYSEVHNDTHQLAQRGDIIQIDLTVYATVINGWSIGGNAILGSWEYPITRTMNIPAVKYYRGFD